MNRYSNKYEDLFDNVEDVNDDEEYESSNLNEVVKRPRRNSDDEFDNEFFD
jgi:hypothetical protein